MAPKAHSKAKDVKPPPSTPTPKSKSKVEAVETPKKTPTTSVKKAKAAAPPRNWKNLPVEDGAITAIEVKHEGTQQAPALSRGGYSMTLKLDASNAFGIVKTARQFSLSTMFNETCH